jgi:flagellar hook assembly protein FlgD
MPNGLLPSTVVFLSNPSGTVNGNVITWVLGAVSTGDLRVSFTVQVDPLAEGNSVLRNVGHAVSPSALPVDAWTDTTVRGDVQVTVSVYNEAGEVVRTFPAKYLSKPVDDMQVSQNGVISNMGDSVTMTWGGGRVLGTWDGTGNGGQIVGNGTYYVKVDSVDAYGTTTSVTKPLTVNRRVVRLTITIYNEAGELVRNLYSENPGTDAKITDVTLTTQVIHPGGDGKDGLQTTVGIVLSNGVGTPWDGTSDNGMNVNDGLYYVHVKVENATNGTVEFTKTVSVMGSRANTGNTGVWPNVLKADQTVMTLHAHNLDETQRIRAVLYTIAGMKAGTVEGLVGQNDVKWDLGGYQSGLYLVVMDTLEGGRLKDRTTLKLIVQK